MFSEQRTSENQSRRRDAPLEKCCPHPGRRRLMKRCIKTLFLSLAISLCLIDYSTEARSTDYRIVDTGQNLCYNNFSKIPCPNPGEAFYGQDAQ